MQDIRPEKKTVDHEVQTRIFIRSTNSGRPAKSLSNRGCQTIISAEPDQSIQTIRALFQFLPQQQIDKGGLHEFKLPRAALLQWKLPLTSYEQIQKEHVRQQNELQRKTNELANNSNYVTKGVLKKRESEKNLGEWAALLALSHPQAMADELVDRETQTNFTVRPHVLGEEQVAQLARASSLQTSLTFNPDASITEIQPFLIKDVDHFHAYVSTITPKPYVNSSNEAVEKQQKEPVVARAYETTDNKRFADESSQSPNEIPKDDDGKDTIAEEHATLDQFVDMLLTDLTDKSIPTDVKDYLLQELAEFSLLPDKEYNANNTKDISTENKITDAPLSSQTEDGAFERVVSQIMNSCVYNIEDQLKRIMDTFDTYQKDLKNMNRELDNIPVNDTDETNNQKIPDHAQTPSVPLESGQENQNIGEGIPPQSMDMQGDSNLKRTVDVVCECCQLTAGGAAVPILNDPSQFDGNRPVTFDVVVGPDGIELANNTKSTPSNGEQIIRFSIVPSRPHVDQPGTSKTNSTQRNAFEIHVSCPDISNGKLPNDTFGTDIGTGREHDCTVVLPPKRIMRTSEDNLDINGTSQQIGLMFEQDADYVEPYILNVEDATVPINMLPISSKPKRTKAMKPFEVEESEDCTVAIEVPWDVITLQLISDDPNKVTREGCCADHIEPTCTRTFCPMGTYHLDDKNMPCTVQFDNNNEEIEFENDPNNDDMNYEPAVTRRNIITASTSEIHGSESDIFAHEDNDHHHTKAKRIPTDALLYDTKFERHNEPYMDYMYNHFPDDNIDGNCGSETEIPWELFTLPTDAKIRKAKKAPAKNASNKGIQPNGSAVTGISDIVIKMNATIESPQEDLKSQFGINLSVAAETVSNIFFVDGAAGSQKSMSHYSMISDFRYVAKRCPNNLAIEFNFADDGTISAIVAGSETFVLARNLNVNDISTHTMEIKPFTECTHKSEQATFITGAIEEKYTTVSVLGNILTETQSLGGNGVRAPSTVPKSQAHSMPDIPSRGNVSFSPDPVGVANPATACKTANPQKTNQDPIASALDAYRAEMKPLREALDKLKEEVRQLNLPQLVPNYYGEYPQQYPAPNSTYPGPSVRHTTAITSGCGTKTSTRMKPLFMQNMVGSPYSPVPYAPPPPGVPPMPYYMPPQQYPPMPYPVPGIMVPYPQPPGPQQPSDLYSHHEYTPINTPSCKSRRRKKRKKEGSVGSKDSQLNQQASISNKEKCSAPLCPNNNAKSEENAVETHYGPKEIIDDSSEVSMNTTCCVINNKYKIEITPDKPLNVQKEVSTEASHPIALDESLNDQMELTTEASHSTEMTSATHAESVEFPISTLQQQDTTPPRNVLEDLPQENQSNLEEASIHETDKEPPST